MKFLFLLCLSFQLFALNVSIKDILEPDSYSENYLVFASNGEVLEVAPSEEALLADIYWAKENNQEIELMTERNRLKSKDARRSVINSRFLNFEKKNNEAVELFDDYVPTPMDNYRVARAASTDVIKRMFLSQRRELREDSQCYNRAHIWVYNLATRFIPNRTINLGKMWIFFTRRYIREYRYKWWFHISPYTYLRGDHREIMLDRTYMSSPRRFVNWKNFFMKNNAPCREVRYYSHYRNNQERAYCYVIKSSMYYYQPYQIENLERGYKTRRGFLQRELDLARRDAL